MAEDRPQGQRVWYSRDFPRGEMPALAFDLSAIDFCFVEVLPPLDGEDGASRVVRFRIGGHRRGTHSRKVEE